MIVLSCLWKSGAQYDHVLEEKDAWRKVEEEDQVIYDCYSIPSNQLIVLLPFLCPAVNTHPQVALTFRLLFALNTSFHLFRFHSWPLSLVSFHLGCLPPGAVDLKTAVAREIPGRSCRPKEA